MTGEEPVGVVLAAGRGTRFGATKQLALLDGRPLVAHAAATLAAAGLPVLVVVGHDGDAVAAAARAEVPDARIVDNPDHRDGIATSLARAARAAGRRTLVVVLADQPGIRPDDVTAVVAALASGATAARVQHADGPGHPVGLSAALHDRLVGLTGRQGRRLLDALDAVPVTVDHPRPADIDTREDLERLARRRDRQEHGG